MSASMAMRSRWRCSARKRAWPPTKMPPTASSSRSTSGRAMSASRNACSRGHSDGSAMREPIMRAPTAEAGELLVEERPGPLAEARVDRAVEGEHALGDRSGRGDDHHHHELGLQQQHLDVADGRGLGRRRGHDAEQVGDLGDDVREPAEGGVDLAPHLGQVERRLDHRRRARRRVADQQGVDVVAVARGRWARAPPRCGGGRGSPAPRGAPARSARWRRRSRCPRGRRCSCSRPACPSAMCSSTTVRRISSWRGLRRGVVAVVTRTP